VYDNSNAVILTDNKLKHRWMVKIRDSISHLHRLNLRRRSRGTL